MSYLHKTVYAYRPPGSTWDSSPRDSATRSMPALAAQVILLWFDQSTSTWSSGFTCMRSNVLVLNVTRLHPMHACLYILYIVGCIFSPSVCSNPKGQQQLAVSHDQSSQNCSMAAISMAKSRSLTLLLKLGLLSTPESSCSKPGIV